MLYNAFRAVALVGLGVAVANNNSNASNDTSEDTTSDTNATTAPTTDPGTPAPAARCGTDGAFAASKRALSVRILNATEGESSSDSLECASCRFEIKGDSKGSARRLNATDESSTSNYHSNGCPKTFSSTEADFFKAVVVMGACKIAKVADYKAATGDDKVCKDAMLNNMVIDFQCRGSEETDFAKVDAAAARQLSAQKVVLRFTAVIDLVDAAAAGLATTALETAVGRMAGFSVDVITALVAEVATDATFADAVAFVDVKAVEIAGVQTEFKTPSGVQTATELLDACAAASPPSYCTNVNAGKDDQAAGDAQNNDAAEDSAFNFLLSTLVCGFVGLFL